MPRYFTAAILAVLSFFTIGPFVKLLSPQFSIATITFFRAFFGFLFVLAIIPFIEKEKIKFKKSEFQTHAFIGFLLAAAMTLITAAFTLATMTDVFFLINIHVFLGPIFAYFLLKEKYSPVMFLVISAGIIGILFIDFFEGQSAAGNLMAIGFGIVYAIMSVFMRKEDKTHGLTDVVWFLGFASLFLFPFALLEPLSNITLEGFLLLALSGVVSAGLGYLFFNLALEKLRVHIVSMLDLLIPPLFGLILDIFVFSEPVTDDVLIGGTLIIIAGLIFLHRQHLLNVRLKLPPTKKVIYATSFLQKKAS
jgi:drug/metabolite transporter (DMT)-like permease